MANEEVPLELIPDEVKGQEVPLELLPENLKIPQESNEEEETASEEEAQVAEKEDEEVLTPVIEQTNSLLAEIKNILETPKPQNTMLNDLHRITALIQKSMAQLSGREYPKPNDISTIESTLKEINKAQETIIKAIKDASSKQHYWTFELHRNMDGLTKITATEIEKPAQVGRA